MVMPGYSYVCTLGHGARSRIVQVVEIRTGKTYALKRVIRNSDEDDRFIEQGENEFRVASQVDHPAIRHCHQIRRIRKWMKIRELQILMDYVNGHTLEQKPPESLAELVSIFHKVAEGIQAMHEAGYVHADMKPNNVMVTVKGEVKLIDLGQSCPIGHVKRRIQGTPDYIAPEQVRRLPINRATDVFNLGATLYWILTGQPYPTILPARTRSTGIDLVTTREAIPPSEVNPEIPLALSSLVMDCCMENPSDRPADMPKFLSRLKVAELMLQKSEMPSNAPVTNGSRPSNSASTPAADRSA